MFTGDAYTHACISFDISCHNMYSFGRLYCRLPFPGGMVSEGIDRGLMALKPNSPCSLYVINTDEPSYWRLCRIIKFMFLYRKRYKYNLLGVAMCWFKREYAPADRYFCSQFVASSLEKSGVLELDKPSALYRPGDFLMHKDLHLLYRGTLKGLADELQNVKKDS